MLFWMCERQRVWVSVVLVALVAVVWGCSNPNVGPDAPTTGPSNSQDGQSAGTSAGTSGGASGSAEGGGEADVNAPEPIKADDGRALKEVIAAAQAAVATAAKAADPMGTPESARAVVKAATENTTDAAAQCNALLMSWTTADPENADDQALMIKLHVCAKDFAKAQALAWAAAEKFEAQRADLIKLWYAAFAADPVFFPPVILTLEENAPMDKLAVMAKAGTSILFKATKDDEKIGVFKPEQTLWLSNYRGEIAAYRLCPLIHCGFNVPHNQEARIAKDVFNRIHATDEAWMAEREGKGIKLTWFKDADGKSWLYGTYKEWIKEFTHFPIEDSELWDDVLMVDGPPIADLEAAPFETFLTRIKKKREKKYKAMLETAAGVTTMEFARQLSNLHVFDALTNNWDRYSGQNLPGVNCQFTAGKFMSIDNGATFQNKKHKESTDHKDQYTAAGRRMRQRVERYSRSTINALRWMDTEAIRPILFPPTTFHPDEDERFELFLERREAILEHVDKLIKKHGEEKVLVFP